MLITDKNEETILQILPIKNGIYKSTAVIQILLNFAIYNMHFVVSILIDNAVGYFLKYRQYFY